MNSALLNVFGRNHKELQILYWDIIPGKKDAAFCYLWPTLLSSSMDLSPLLLEIMKQSFLGRKTV